jgi:hypothetical protein
MSKLTADVDEVFGTLEDWIAEGRKRLQPVAAEVEKYADPFISTLSAGLAAAGIVVPVKYVDVALSLVSKLTQLDPEVSAPAAPVAPADPAAPVADAPAGDEAQQVAS